MFTIAGILADEEPKTPISPNGFYNASYMYDASFNSVTLDSTDMLNNRSEFTFMFWVYKREDVFWGSWSTGTGGEVNPIFNWSVINNQNNIEFKIRNTSGGHTVVNTNYNWLLKWTLFTVTGSLLSNSIKIYADGVLLNTATMSYPVSDNYLSYSFRRVNSSPYSLAQPLFYDRALSDTEVAEHYIDVDGQVGMLAYDAMTTSQRSGLTYLASFVDDISYNGNEFKDKSTNNVTLSDTPSLTGQQIYVYTDVATTQTYAVNSADLNGSSQYFDAGNPTELQITGSVTCATWVKFDNSSEMSIMGKWGPNPSLGGFALGRSVVTSGSLFWQPRINGGVPVFLEIPVNNDQWYFVIAEYDGTTVSLEKDRETPVTSTQVGSLDSNTANNFYFGRNPDTGLSYLNGSMYSPFVINRVLTTQEKDALYGNGIPPCFNEWPQSVKDDILISPKLGNYNGNTGSETVDRSSNNLTITNINGTPYDGTGLNVECTPSATQIYAVNSAELNGTNQYFTYDQSIRNSVLGFSVWVNSDSIATTQRIIAESSTSGNIEVGVQLVVGKVRFLWRNSAGTVQQLDSVTTLLSDTWYHLACTYDTSQGMKIYINGVLDNSNSNTGTISATAITGRHIGTYQDLLNFFDGNISMLSVYNRYLSQSDVDTLYNNGTPLCYADIDTAITADGVYAPRLANWDTNAGQELIDQSGSGITTTNVNSTPFTGTGLNVECST